MTTYQLSKTTLQYDQSLINISNPARQCIELLTQNYIWPICCVPLPCLRHTTVSTLCKLI